MIEIGVNIIINEHEIQYENRGHNHDLQGKRSQSLLGKIDEIESMWKNETAFFCQNFYVNTLKI